LETPSIENTETLMGKYGDEGDKLIFKILNNGLDNPEKKDTAIKEFDLVLTGKTSKGITERALRYDLTIPFARYVSMNHGQLTFPFKRYQMQPVWRADRPQKGRYREFYQCDADVAGSTSLLHETELALIYATVFQKLRVAVEIKINNRKILSALANLCGGADRMMQITIAIDKLDKIGIEKVKEELLSNGLNNEQVQTVEKFISIKGNNDDKIESLQNMFGADLTGQEGISELKHVLQSVNHTSKDCNLIIDLSLARGLNYYTGTIFEVKALDVQMGSIGGGGRYDDLTSLFDLKGIAGVGISFGVDRIYDVMEELKIFPEDIQKGTRVLFFNTGEEELKHIISIAQQLRNQGLASEIFHEAAKFDKQFKYAEKKSIPYVAIMGSREIKQGTCMLKNLSTGEQEEVKQSELPNRLKN
jgi:histidyl-tRNA synthetase